MIHWYHLVKSYWFLLSTKQGMNYENKLHAMFLNVQKGSCDRRAASTAAADCTRAIPNNGC